MVELEFSVVSRQCLHRRISSVAELQQEIEVWEQQRNQIRATVNWRFSTVDSRLRFERLYPIPSLSSSLWWSTRIPMMLMLPLEPIELETGKWPK